MVLFNLVSSRPQSHAHIVQYLPDEKQRDGAVMVQLHAAGQPSTPGRNARGAGRRGDAALRRTSRHTAIRYILRKTNIGPMFIVICCTLLWPPIVSLSFVVRCLIASRCTGRLKAQGS